MHDICSSTSWWKGLRSGCCGQCGHNQHTACHFVCLYTHGCGMRPLEQDFGCMDTATAVRLSPTPCWTYGFRWRTATRVSVSAPGIFLGPSPTMTILHSLPALPHPGFTPNNPQIKWPLELGIWIHTPQICVAPCSCGIGVWLGTFGVAALMSCTSLCVHFMQFCIRRQVHHPLSEPRDHVPPCVWTDKSNSDVTQDGGEDEAQVCALCCVVLWRQKRSTITVHGECKEHYCAEYIDPHTCGDISVC